MQRFAAALLSTAAAAFLATGAAAEYPRLAIRYIAVPAEGLERTLEDLRRLAAASELKALRPHLGETFFWEQDFGGGYNKNDSPLTNLIAALSLDDERLALEHRGAGWSRLMGILRASTSMAHPKRRGIMCVPGKPVFVDQKLAQRTFRMTRTQPDLMQWGFVEDREVAVRSQSNPVAAVIATLRSEAVLVNEWAPDWVRVELPSGARGFVESTDIRTASPERLCFGRSETGTWSIAGYMGGGD